MRPDTSPRYRWYVLLVLMLTYAFSYMDRQILAIVLEDLRDELQLSDTQLGLLSGVAFALFYSTLGVPIARLADRRNRVAIISVALAFWSVMTALCGVAQNFLQLFVYRIGVGIGEAGGTPPAHALIADYFARHERAMALSVYSLGLAFGAVLGLALGGLIAEVHGWRTAFVVAGLPGVLLALLVHWTVREPARGAMEESLAAIDAPAGGTLLQTVQRLWARPAYRLLAISSLLTSFGSHSISTWLPSYFIRQFALGQSEAGLATALINLLGGVPGLLLGGWLGDRLARRQVGWLGRLPALALGLALCTVLGGVWSANYSLAVFFFGCSLFLYQFSHGPSLAAIQWTLAPGERAQGAAFVFFLGNLFGLTLGPLLVGAVSDLGAERFGSQSLSLGLSAVTLFLIAASITYWRAGAALARTQ